MTWQDDDDYLASGSGAPWIRNRDRHLTRYRALSIGQVCKSGSNTGSTDLSDELWALRLYVDATKRREISRYQKDHAYLFNAASAALFEPLSATAVQVARQLACAGANATEIAEIIGGSPLRAYRVTKAVRVPTGWRTGWYTAEQMQADMQRWYGPSAAITAAGR